jgi:hypothetical protein
MREIALRRGTWRRLRSRELLDESEKQLDEQIFSDGIGQIMAVGGTVRLDFVALSPTEKDAKGQPALVFCQRVVMSTEAFLAAADKIQEVAGAIAKSATRLRVEPQPAERSSTLAAAEPNSAPLPSARSGPHFP